MDAPLQGFPSIRTAFDRSLWLTTLRPLEDADAAPRDRLEAYFELLDFICDARLGDRAGNDASQAPDASDQDEALAGALDLLTYTRALLARLMRQAAAGSPRDLPERVDAVMASGLAVTTSVAGHRHHDHRPHLHLRLKAARQFALQAL
ncbi:hypothetical protein [Pigmentiphaga litoralis]|uniref:Uncharacterized protein n=1 Tax=Pigmentiphaga litoralis TaxID=516702 RepID=A0A7Y9ITU2_9BURK|nr:hypothetical protein [Pigmentiphaga litoralis]NYE23401.1 hypothetical protein [Pigmentiphaga litoralis]NYE82985.1 hypothetical protein [Pigmentiphaga litoralis]